MRQLTLGSLFDGVGTWQLSAIQNGIQPVWCSEIDDFPATVSQSHFPKTEQLGDITKINPDDLAPVDIICAGSPCFTAGTSIQTQDGIKPVEKVAVGDLVIADDCQWHKVIETMENPADAIYTIKANGLLDIQTTANHPFYVKHEKDSSKKAEYVLAKDLMEGDLVGFPILQTSKNEMQVTDEEARLVGKFLADNGEFRISTKRQMDLCLMCGTEADEKEIPGIFLNLPSCLLKSLIDSYMSYAGLEIDGCHKTATASRKLALSLQAAVHKAFGTAAEIQFSEQTGIYHITWAESPLMDACETILNGYVWQPVTGIAKEEKRVRVYNLEVEDVHSYTANGIMVHNCQDLSVAGKRAGLKGERSGLFRTAIKIVHDLRERTGSPRWFVWENVPGAFSSNKGHDFRAVLEEITKTEIPMPAGGKWAEAGMVEWGNSSLAWRVLDARFWGVPQRRRRIFLVADFGGKSAGEVLFVEQGLQGNPEEGGAKRKDSSGAASESLGSTVSRVVAYSFDSLSSNSMKSKNPYSGCRQVSISKTLDTTIPSPEKNQGGIAIQCLNDQGGCRMSVSEDKTATLRAQTHGHEPVVHHPPVTTYCIVGNIIDRQVKNGGNGLGVKGNECYTLNTVDRHAVYKEEPDYNRRTVGCLNARDYKGVGNQYVSEGKLVIDEQH